MWRRAIVLVLIAGALNGAGTGLAGDGHRQLAFIIISIAGFLNMIAGAYLGSDNK